MKRRRRESRLSYALFDLLVSTCVEVYSGRIDFSSLTSRASKLERIASGRWVQTIAFGAYYGTTHKSCAGISAWSCSGSARATWDVIPSSLSTSLQHVPAQFPPSRHPWYITRNPGVSWGIQSVLYNSSGNPDRVCRLGLCKKKAAAKASWPTASNCRDIRPGEWCQTAESWNFEGSGRLVWMSKEVRRCERYLRRPPPPEML